MALACGSTPHQVLASDGARPEGALAPRPWAEQRVQAGERELMDTAGHSVGQRATEVVRYVGHVKRLHPATPDGALEAFGEATVNPSADIIDEGAHPAPEPTLRREALTREAHRGLSGHVKPPRAPASPVVATSLAWAPGDALNLEAELAAKDTLEARFPRGQRLRFANPDMKPALLETLAHRPGGLYVRAAPPGERRSAGDLVATLLDGLPALPPTLSRARLAPVPVEARVQQPSGRIVPLVLP